MRIPRKRKKHLKKLSKELINQRSQDSLMLPIVRLQNGDYFMLGYNLIESNYILTQIGFYEPTKN